MNGEELDEFETVHELFGQAPSVQSEQSHHSELEESFVDQVPVQAVGQQAAQFTSEFGQLDSKVPEHMKEFDRRLTDA